MLIRYSADKSTIDEPGEKVITRLAITYGTLRRLGFSEDVVEECLRSINGVELDEAYQWVSATVCVYRTRVQLTIKLLLASGPSSGGGARIRTRSVRLLYPHCCTYHTLPTLSEEVRSPQSVQTAFSSLPSLTPSTINRNASPMVSSPASSFPPSRDEPSSSNVPESSGDLPRALSEDESPTDDPNEKYVRLKMRIADLTTHRKPNDTRDAAFVKSLQKRLEEVKQDYFFDQNEAEAVYRVEREKADAEFLLSHLRKPKDTPTPPALTPGTTHVQSSSRRPQQPAKQETPQKPAIVSEEIDIFEEEDDAPGGMFELLEAPPTTETTQEGTIIQVRDMPLPKHWSGRTPKVLLLDMIKKLDKFASTELRVISGSSRAKRAALCVRWSQGRHSEWAMEDVACHDNAQADQFMSLVALHALTFPATAGFAPGGTSVSTSQTFFRLLPPMHRDLWDELETKRRNQDDSTNRAVWAKLRDILGPKLAIPKVIRGRCVIVLQWLTVYYLDPRQSREACG